MNKGDLPLSLSISASEGNKELHSFSEHLKKPVCALLEPHERSAQFMARTYVTFRCHRGRVRLNILYLGKHQLEEALLVTY